jgi:hypothetical protein
MTVEQWLDYFKEKGIAIQITLDIHKDPTVHAILPKDYKGELKGIQFTEHETLLGALKMMVNKINR